MGFRDRFLTPATARAILSWRLVLGAAVGVVAGLLGAAIPLAIVLGLAAYAGAVVLAMPKPAARATIDPFAVGEPWRQFLQGAERSRRRLTETIRSTPAGPLRDRLASVAARLDEGLVETWEIARRGDSIDAAISRLDPTRLRSRLDTLRQQGGETPTVDAAAAITSVESQLASAERLKQQSASAADRLRLTQARLDELVARSAEVSIGAGDDEVFAHDVDNLVVELEGVRLAIEETRGEPG